AAGERLSWWRSRLPPWLAREADRARRNRRAPGSADRARRRFRVTALTPHPALLGFKKSTQHPEMKEGCVMGSGVMTRREVRRQFWLLVRSGVMRRAAATALGFDPDTGRDWFRQAGGVIPAFVTKLPSGRCLSFAEREEIFAGVERGDS